ncbi:MAG: hypothetical protein ACR2MG_07055 [Pyrinomonadaceae bacterium]
MKNLTLNFLTERNSRLDLACGILILLVLVLGCSDGGDSNSSGETAKKSVPPAYIGVWTGQDGSTVTLRNDSTGDYKSGGKSVSGAAVEIDEAAKEIRFSLLGFDSGKYKIDQAPAGNRMKLDGMEYRRTAGFSTEDSENKTDATTSGEVPTEDELRPIASKTIQDFDDALQQGDFADFYSTVSETWQSQITAAELDKAFAPIAAQKNNYKLKADAPLVFSSKPALKDDVLEINGGYQNVKGKNIPFRLKYIKESDDWKLLGIRLNP